MKHNQKSDRPMSCEHLSREQRRAVVWRAAQTVRCGGYHDGEDWDAIVERIASTTDLAALVQEYKSDEEKHLQESILSSSQQREAGNPLPVDRPSLPLAF